MGKYTNLYRERAAILLKFPTTVFPYNVYNFSLKRLWGSPITFTILPITIKDFPCNFIVVSLCIVFPYQFYKYGVYFPLKSLHSFTVYLMHTCFRSSTLYEFWRQQFLYQKIKVCWNSLPPIQDWCVKTTMQLVFTFKWVE